MIEFSHIYKTYGEGEEATHVLRDVSFTIKKGEFVAIMGPSGSGKSTIMNILGLLDVPSKGSYHFEGKDVSKLSDDEQAAIRAEKIGFVFSVV
jgi:putative ABC transport system ATP-binding protein